MENKKNKKPVEKMQLSLKKASGMIEKIKSMIDDDVYCVHIAQQVQATIGLLKGVNTLMLKKHLQCCGKKNLVSTNPTEVEEFIDELVKTREGTIK